MDKRIVQDEVVYEGAICRVHKVGLEVADGEVVRRDLIEFDDATVIVPVLPDGRVVFIRNERFAVGEELLELPAGKLDGDEDPGDGAARELTEETGYTAGRVEPLGGFYSSPGSLTEYMHAFLATELQAGEQALEAYEQIRVEIVAAERVDELIASGQLHDAKSIAALAMWRAREGREAR